METQDLLFESPYFCKIEEYEGSHMSKKYTILSLFTGCGGLDLGFLGGFKYLGKNYHKNNFEVVWANDINKDACKSFEKYFKKDIICGDIRDILSGELPAPKIPDHVDVVLGGFPCQDFSHAGKRRGFDSKRGLLYQSMVEVVKRTTPLVFMAENVRGLLTMPGALAKIKKDFGELGYHVEHKLLLAADYGVPQMRERVIIIGTKKKSLPSFAGNYPAPTTENSPVTLEKAIKDLEKKKAGEIQNHYWSGAKKNNGQGNSVVSKDKPGPTMRSEHHGNIEYHWNATRRLSAREAARIQSFPDNFEFMPSTSAAYRQIGNAVPPVLGWHMAVSIENFIKANLGAKGVTNDCRKRGKRERSKV